MEPAELNTERLLLRPFRLDDVDDVLAYASNPEWARFLPPVPLDYTRRHAGSRPVKWCKSTSSC